MQVEFAYATEEQAPLLSDIAVQAKGHWGYSQEQLELWRKDMRIEKAYIRNNTVKVVLVDDEVVGFFALKVADSALLDNLWLLPKVIGKGVGARTFIDITSECRILGVDAFTIISDPDAQGFYYRQGAVKIGEVYSEAQQRMLPKLIYKLSW